MSEPTTKQFIPPCRTDKTVSDIEDIVIDGVARKRPNKIRYLCSFRRRLIPGHTYRWCACGRSEDIFCDDSCGPNDLAPLEFAVSQDVRNHSLCGCRYTANPPFCDGQHAIPELDQEEYAEEFGVEIPLPPWAKEGSETETNEAAADDDESTQTTTEEKKDNDNDNTSS